MEEYRRLCRLEDNVKMDLKDTGVDVMNLIGSVQDKDLEESL